MMQGAGYIYASPARHVIEIRYPPKVVNVETTSLYSPVYHHRRLILDRLCFCGISGNLLNLSI